MSRLAVLLGLGLLSAAAARPSAGQLPPPIKGGVTLVTIDVTVLDSDGRPVIDLGAADFEVKLNGRVQPVRAVTLLQAGSSSEMSGAVGPAFDAVTPAPPPAAGRRTAPTPTPTPRSFVILVDDLSFLPTRGRGLFAAAQRFLAALPASDRVGLATTTATTTINPTADRAAVRQALSKIVGAYIDPVSTAGRGPASDKFTSPDQAAGVAQSVAIDRGDPGALEDAIIRECFNGVRTALNGQSIAQVLADNQCASTVQSEARRTAAVIKQTVEQQLRAYTGVIRAMQPAPGIKHLVLLTDGVGLEQEVSSLAPVARAAAEAGIQVSVIMETADPSMADEGRRSAPGAQQTDLGAAQRRREDAAMFQAGARTVADNIGATFHFVTGSPDPFFARVQLAASAVYRLAIEPPADTPAGKEFALGARVKRGGLTALAARRAVSGSPAPATPPPTPSFPGASKPVTTEERLRSAIATGRSANELDIAIGRSVRRGDSPARIAVEVSVDLPANAQGAVTALLGIVDERGAIRTAQKEVDAGTRHLTFSVPLDPGAFKLRFAAADASGAVGSVETTVEARLHPLGPLTGSDLLRFTVNSTGEQLPLVRDTIPRDAKALLVALELYPAGEPPADLLVKMTLTGETGSEVERIVTPEERGGVLTVEAEFLAERLAGAYTLRATLMSGATVLGSISAAVKR